MGINDELMKSVSDDLKDIKQDLQSKGTELVKLSRQLAVLADRQDAGKELVSELSKLQLVVHETGDATKSLDGDLKAIKNDLEGSKTVSKILWGFTLTLLVFALGGGFYAGITNVSIQYNLGKNTEAVENLDKTSAERSGAAAERMAALNTSVDSVKGDLAITSSALSTKIGDAKANTEKVSSQIAALKGEMVAQLDELGSAVAAAKREIQDATEAAKKEAIAAITSAASAEVFTLDLVLGKSDLDDARSHEDRVSFTIDAPPLADVTVIRSRVELVPRAAEAFGEPPKPMPAFFLRCEVSDGKIHVDAWPLRKDGDVFTQLTSTPIHIEIEYVPRATE